MSSGAVTLKFIQSLHLWTLNSFHNWLSALIVFLCFYLSVGSLQSGQMDTFDSKRSRASLQFHHSGDCWSASVKVQLLFVCLEPFPSVSCTGLGWSETYRNSKALITPSSICDISSPEIGATVQTSSACCLFTQDPHFLLSIDSNLNYHTALTCRLFARKSSSKALIAVSTITLQRPWPVACLQDHITQGQDSSLSYHSLPFSCAHEPF